jgi:hypothetical protein
MYGVDTSHQAAQDWYDSIFELYAEWEVDYIKIDNIAYPYYKDEIEMVSKAIQNCGRDMYLSLSPGPAPIEAASHLKKYANSWRISADYWDRWEDLYDQFELCSKWIEHAEEGSWPDADMLPFGHIAIRSEEHHRTDRWTEFSQDEQRFMMSLWSLARSPLMFGGEMTDNDQFTLDLLTNKEVLNILKKSKNNRQLYRENDCAAWTAEGYNGEIYLAHFNLNGGKKEIITNLKQLGLSGEFKVKDIWEKKDLENTSQQIISTVDPHAVKLYKLSSVK